MLYNILTLEVNTTYPKVKLALQTNFLQLSIQPCNQQLFINIGLASPLNKFLPDLCNLKPLLVQIIEEGPVGLFGGGIFRGCRLSINCQQIFMDFPFCRLANERRLKWEQQMIQSDATKSHINNGKLTEYRLNSALLLRNILYCSTRNKMATRILTEPFHVSRLH